MRSTWFARNVLRESREFGGAFLPFGSTGRALLVLLLCVPIPPLEGGTEATGGRLKAFVSIPPQAFFVERVGGSHVAVEVLVPPGQSPHTFEPTPRQMARLAEADVFFSIGVPFEKVFLPFLGDACKNLKIVDTRDGIPLRMMEERPHEEHATGDAHDEGHHHPAGTPDPHVWLDPQRAKILAKNISASLASLDPKNDGDYERNLQALLRDLDSADEQLAQNLEKYKGRAFFVFHPAYGYFAERYGLEQIAVEAGGKEPSARDLAALVDRAKRERVRVVFVQPQFSQSTAKTIAREIGGVVLPLDPLAEDYLENLEKMGERVAEAFAESDGAP